MSDLYTRMQATASSLLESYGQGVITYDVDGAATGDAWNPIPGATVQHPIDAVVSGVGADYVDGTTIVASDLMLTCSVFGVVPSMSGRITMDGKEYQVVKFEQIPAAGTPVAWRIFFRG